MSGHHSLISQRQSLTQPLGRRLDSLIRLSVGAECSSTLRKTAWCSSSTMSSPSTPVQLKPFVHVTSRALFKPSCLHGNENVNPSGRLTVVSRFFSVMKSSMQSAMWSKSYKTWKIQHIGGRIDRQWHRTRGVWAAHLGTSSCHHGLRDHVYFTGHVCLLTVELYQEHPEVCPTEIQSEEISLLCKTISW